MAVCPHYAAVFWTELYFGNISREKYTHKLPDFGNLDFKIWSWLKRGGITRMHGIVHLMAEILLARDADCINTFPRYNIFLWKWQVDSFAPIICRRIIWYWCTVNGYLIIFCLYIQRLIDWLVFNFFSDNNSSFMFEWSI
jgi:hypothetical protein